MGFYRIIYRVPKKGDLVAICLPDSLARQALQLHYISYGSCANYSMPLLKYLFAKDGDQVTLQQQFVAINGQPLANSATLLQDHRGRYLYHVNRGNYSVLPDQIWVFSFDHTDSWDSRYFGPISATNIIGVAEKW